ncbi:MAG: hypothetical protein GW946_02505 [Candidatus Pacebacteria bacterium]|nr:hypothetical protein [Candidatus Paceibacterota bacterium]PIR60045.1 MAG: hypothetical protein COU67_03850 [Candidatus Pacebacteria bacterium CG10_big_fil_rev_8_21_14_0_10_44_54]
MKKFLKHHWSNHAISAIVAAVVFATRGGMLPPNVSPLGASGFSTKNFYWFFAGILAFDLFRGGTYPGVLLTYTGFAMYPLLGRLAGKSLHKQVIFLPLASLLFFLLSNLGVWWFWYPRTLDALMLCYALALPFYRNTFLSDLGFFATVVSVRRVWSILHKRTSRGLAVV